MACLAAAGLPAAAFGAPTTDRQRIIFNRDWKSALGDHPGAGAPGFQDASWEPIELPHSFSLPHFRSAEFYVGYGWYRKHFQARPEWRGKRLFLEFDAAFQDAEVVVNGRSAGRHQGGYTGFSLDITDLVKPGDNLVAVRLNNNWNPRLAPRAGAHEFCGGIYRDVYLLVANPLHVTWDGTFVTTPQVSAASARVNVGCRSRPAGSHQRFAPPGRWQPAAPSPSTRPPTPSPGRSPRQAHARLRCRLPSLAGVG